MTVRVDKDFCIGCELCVSQCVDMFAMDNDGKAGVVQQPAQTIPDEDCALAAAEGCPTDAILVQ